jgi:hypothetical protein
MCLASLSLAKRLGPALVARWSEEARQQHGQNTSEKHPIERPGAADGGAISEIQPNSCLTGCTTGTTRTSSSRQSVVLATA